MAERLAERMGIELPEAFPADSPGNGEIGEEDLFDDDASAATTARFEPLSQLLADSSQSEEIADAIADICTEIQEENRDEADTKKPLKQIKRAKSMLSNVEIDKAGDDTIDDIRSELDQIIALAEGLLAQTEETEGSAS